VLPSSEIAWLLPAEGEQQDRGRQLVALSGGG
jgi:hypothetical protein